MRIKPKQNIQIIFLLLILLCLNGCIGTSETFAQLKLYSATQYDLASCGKGGNRGVACSILNMPIDIILDTVLLPYKTYLILK